MEAVFNKVVEIVERFFDFREYTIVAFLNIECALNNAITLSTQHTLTDVEVGE